MVWQYNLVNNFPIYKKYGILSTHVEADIFTQAASLQTAATAAQAPTVLVGCVTPVAKDVKTHVM